jgi:hypothetical protein
MDAITYFFVSSGTLIVTFCLVFFILGFGAGWFVWGRTVHEYQSKINPLEKDKELLKGELKLCEEKVNALLKVNQS